MQDSKVTEFTVKRKEPLPKFIQILIYVSVLLICILTAILIYQHSNSVSSADQYVYADLDNTNILDIQEYKGNVILLTQAKAIYVEKNGKSHDGSSFTYSNPIMKVNNGNVLIYDRGGTGFRVENYRNTYYTQEAPGIIVTAQISKKNTVAFSVDSESDSFSQTSVYIKKNSGSDIKKIYKSATAYCISLAISDDDKYVAIAMLDNVNAENIVTVYICNLETEEIKEVPAFTEIVLTGFDYLSNGDLSIHTDKGIYTVSEKDFSLTLETEFNSTDYISSFINPSGLTTVLLATSGNKNSPVLQIYTKNGELKETLNFEKAVEKVSCSEKHFAVLFDSEIFVYTYSGTCIGKFSTEDTIRDLCLTESKLYILQSSDLCITDIFTESSELFIENKNKSDENSTFQLEAND